MTPTPVKPSETTRSETYTGRDLIAVIEQESAAGTNGQIIINLSQGHPSMIEVRKKIVIDLTTR